MKYTDYRFSLVAPTLNVENVTAVINEIIAPAPSADDERRSPPNNYPEGFPNLIDGHSDYGLATRVENSGFSNQQVVFDFNGTIKTNTHFNLGTIKIEPNTDKKIVGLPTINIESIFKRTKVDNDVNLYLKTTDVEHTYDLFLNFIAPFPENVRFILNYNEISSLTRSLEITDVSFGGSIIRPNKEEREIKIIGTPYTPFELTLTDDDDQSILRDNITSTETLGSSIESSIPSSGVYVTKQCFPGLKNIIRTKINGSMAASGASTIIFDSLSGVEVGDQLFMNEITNGSAVKVTAINVGGNANQCTLSSSVTASDDARARFSRSTSYKLNIMSTETLGPLIPTTNPTYTISQNTDTIITLRLSKTATDYTIAEGGTNGGASDTAFDKTFVGRAGFEMARFTNQNIYLNKLSINNMRSYGSISYVLDGVGGKTLSVLKTPVFSQYEPDSDFTNTDPSINGGTHIDITGIETELTDSDGKCNLHITFEIVKYGTEDVVIDLDLDNIIS
jgi:hypothetical protein